MASNTPLTPAERQQILDLHAAGGTCRGIARQVGRATTTVARVCHDAGLTFDRSRTAAATAAKTIDNKARRALLIGRLYGQAETILDRLEAPTYQTMIKGMGGAEQERTLDFVPPVDRKNDLTSAAIAMDKALKLEQVDAGQTGDQATSMLERLTEQLQGVNLVDHLNPDGSGQPEAAPLPGDQ